MVEKRRLVRAGTAVVPLFDTLVAPAALAAYLKAFYSTRGSYARTTYSLGGK